LEIQKQDLFKHAPKAKYRESYTVKNLHNIFTSTMIQLQSHIFVDMHQSGYIVPPKYSTKDKY